MVRVTFRYRDDYTHGQWSTQTCVVRSVEECKRIYGLGTDPTCEYEIINIQNWLLTSRT